MTPHVFAGRHILVTNHNPQRRYFITRNRIVVLRRYRETIASGRRTN